MIETRVVMQMALDLLIDSMDSVNNAYIDAVNMYSNYPSLQRKITTLENDVNKHTAAITALQQAIAQQEQTELVRQPLTDAEIDALWSTTKLTLPQKISRRAIARAVESAYNTTQPRADFTTGQEFVTFAQPEPACSDHPDAPHGFDRNASHSAHRYVCDCEGWEPDDESIDPMQTLIDTTQELGLYEDSPPVFHLRQYGDVTAARLDEAIAQPEQTATDKLLQIIAAAYQIAGTCDVPTHILDVLAAPEKAMQEQIDAMLPFVRPAEPDDLTIAYMSGFSDGKKSAQQKDCKP